MPNERKESRPDKPFKKNSKAYKYLHRLSECRKEPYPTDRLERIKLIERRVEEVKQTFGKSKIPPEFIAALKEFRRQTEKEEEEIWSEL